MEVSRSVIPHDHDGDGDLDLWVTNCNGPARLFLNDAPGQGRWLKVRAFDPVTNRDAIGALVEDETTSGRQVRHVTRTSSYLARREPTVDFVLGKAARVELV